MSLFIEYEINNISCTERSEARRVATLHTDVSWVRMSETWRVACSHALSASSTSQTRPGALAHGTTASFPQENCSFPLDIHSQRFAPHSFPARLDKEIACCSKGESKPPGTGTKNGRLQRLSHSSSERPLLWFALLLSVLSSLERRTCDEG